MLFKKGIVRKTFLFSVFLTVLVVLSAFVILYFAMPGYYRKTKTTALENNMNKLTSALSAENNEKNCADLITRFSEENNATVISFDNADMIIPAFSTPFSAMTGGENHFFTTKSTLQNGGEARQIFSITIANELPSFHAAEAQVLLRAPVAGNQAISSVRGDVNSKLISHIAVSGTFQPIDEAKDVLLSLIPYVLLPAIIISILLSGIYARQISKPLLKISQAALKMQQMEPGTVSDVKSNDELGQLSSNLNVLYQSLCENIECLQNEMAKVSHLERSKTEMMQSASHELKTPIAAINGMIEGMLDNVGAYKDKEKYLSECKNQVDKLAELVNEILSASKTDVAENELVLRPLAADVLAERILEENSYSIKKKKLQIHTNLKAAIIQTDELVFCRVLSNLISNAVRYTPESGNVFVSLCNDDGFAVFTIENECEYITAQELNRLFEPFYTRSYSRNKAESGSGLGLYIVRRSLEKLGIEYRAEVTSSTLKISLKLNV